MGNNPHSIDSNLNKNYPSTYQTELGGIVETYGKSPEWMRNFETKIANWMEGFVSGSPSTELNRDELDFILSHMVSSEKDTNYDSNMTSIPTGSLTRVEKAYHIISDIKSGKLKVGDDIPSSSELRSYSRFPGATTRIIKDNNIEEPIIIYKTIGPVNHFNITPYDTRMERERESLVQQTNLKIKNITTYNKDNYSDPHKYARDVEDAIGLSEYLDHLGFTKDISESNLPTPEVTVIEVTPYK